MRHAIKHALAGVGLLAISMPVMAQQSASQPDTEEVDGLPVASEIVVTARRRDESAQDVPLVVNTVTSELIEKLNIRDGLEIQTLVPGLQLRNESNGIGSSGQVRGVQFDINASAGPTVAFYLNDAPIDAGTVLQALYDIGQVEVLRGPQGTLRGTATPSGSITFTTRKPNLDEVGMNASAGISDTGLFNVNGAFNVPIIAGVLGIRVSGIREENNLNRVRSIDTDANLRKPSSEQYGGRAIIAFEPTDWFRAEAMYQASDREMQGYDQYASFGLVSPGAPASAVVIRPKDRQSIQETARRVEQKFKFYNLRTELRYAGQALIYQGSLSKNEFDAITNQDTANFLPARDFFQTTNTRSKLKTHELRLQNDERAFGFLDYVVGYYYTKLRAPTTLTVETPVLLPTFLGGGVATVVPTFISTSGTTTENAVFGNLTVHVGENTEISGGLRQIDVESPARFLIIGGSPISGGPEVDDEKLIYTASIKHRFTPDLMVYASTGTSRRAGPSIVNPAVLVQSPRTRQFLFLDSEDSTSYEVGVKSSLFDGRVVFNVTGFYQKFENFPFKLTTPIFFQQFNFTGGALVPGVGSSAQFAAGVPVKVKGVEAELGWKVTNRLSFNLLAAYADGKVKNGTIPCNDLNGDGVPDVTTTAPTVAQLQGAYGANFIGACQLTQRSTTQSPFNATAQADYTLPVSDGVDGFARALFTYNGKSKVEPTNSFDDLDAYGILNLFAGVRDPDGDWEINGYVKNLFDTIKATRFDPPAVTSFQRLNNNFQGTTGQSFTSTYSQINTNPAREFGVNLRVSLGSR